MQEIWKAIPNYEGLYEASNKGRIKSLKRMVYSPRYKKMINWPEKILVQDQSNNDKGYGRITLSKNGIQERKQIHYWIAITFIPNPENKPCIDHIDDNPRNNSADNLRWVTWQENNEKEHHRKALSEANKGYKHSEERRKKDREVMLKRIEENGLRRGGNYNAKKVNEYDLDMNLIRTWDCLTDAAEYYNITVGCITLVAKGKRKQAKNRIWRYAA